MKPGDLVAYSPHKVVKFYWGKDKVWIGLILEVHDTWVRVLWETGGANEQDYSANSRDAWEVIS